MLWILLLLPVTCALHIHDAYSPLRLGKDQMTPCNKERKLQCKEYCKSELAACLHNKCFCVSLVSEVEPAKKRPTLRHHIAHFCPNLDVARQCIFKCMKYGKPAFCGKDHVCYCGHRYTPIDDDTAYNPKEAYSQFKDLYQKYFGPNYDYSL